MPPRDDEYDVIQVGYGPVGQAAAALLSRDGWRVGVFERWPALYSLARAGHVDDETMRIFQSIGAADEIERRAYPMHGYEWLNARGDELYHFDWDRRGPSGWHAHYNFYQPDLEDALDVCARAGGAAVHQGWEVAELEQSADDVVVTARRRHVLDGMPVVTDESRRARARYLIGVDGANSFVRERCGMGWSDLGYQADWLVIDFRPHDPELSIPGSHEAAQLCDPARPTFLTRRLGWKHCRWEFMLLDGEQHAEVESEARCWDLLSQWVKPDDGAILRSSVYTFRSGIAHEWRADRVFLAGDAAHLMPPFMGQGMCSGHRDVKNLAWKLGLVLRGKARSNLLDSYAIERRPHVEQIINFSMSMGKVVCVTDPRLAEARDRAILGGEAPSHQPFPTLSAGLLHRNAADVAVAPSGHLSHQGVVAYQGRTGRFDDVVGAGFVILALDQDPFALLRSDQRAWLTSLGATVAAISPRYRPAPGVVADLRSTYLTWFREQNMSAVVIRPDYYVFGAASQLDALPRLVDDLRRQLDPVGLAEVW
jgi:2-polyprenyl-6-methoxyphenol hydroxylase-like FAD-dependent oxidoreductase